MDIKIVLGGLEKALWESRPLGANCFVWDSFTETPAWLPRPSSAGCQHAFYLGLQPFVLHRGEGLAIKKYCALIVLTLKKAKGSFRNIHIVLLQREEE